MYEYEHHFNYNRLLFYRFVWRFQKEFVSLLSMR